MLCFLPRRVQPDIRVFLGQQQDRHRLFVDRLDDLIGVGGQEPVEIVCGQAVFDLPDALPLRDVDM